MKQRDDSTIHITKSAKGYWYNLISDQNGQVVGTATRHFMKLPELYALLGMVKTHVLQYKFYKDKAKEWRFRIRVNPQIIMVKSEGYARKVDCVAGSEACFKSLESARVALLFSEDSSVYDLQQLIDNPNLGIVTT